MSKTDEDPRAYIALLDPPDAVRSKVRAAVTGSGRGFRGEDTSPGVENLVSIMAAIRGINAQEVASDFEGRGYAELKEELAETINAFIAPIQRKYEELQAE